MSEEEPRALTSAQVQEALDAGGLVTLYQPCYDLRTGAMVAVEALARLRDPATGELLTPDRFLEGAERSGIVTRLDELMFQEATHQVALWRALPAARGLSVALNLSPADLDDPELLDGIVRMADEAGLPLGAIILELTETLLSRTGRGHEQVLGELSALGCNITLDDFGTGNASFAYLQRFRVDGIKLDRSFVQLLGTGGPNERLVESLLRFCLSLGVHVVAEGIEDERQVEALRRLGCPFGQGFLMSRPLTGEELDRVLRSGDARSRLLAPPACDEVRDGPEAAAPVARRRTSGAVTQRLLGALVALVVVAVVTVAVVGRVHAESSLAAAAQRRLVAVDSLAASEVDSQLGGLRDVVTTYSRSDSVLRAVESRGPRAMQAAMQGLSSATSGIYSSSLYDAQGRLLAVLPSAPGVVGRSFAYRDWYSGARASQEAYVSEAFQLLTPAAPWALAIAAAVRDDAGRPVGYVVASFTLSELQQDLDEVQDRNGVALTLMDSHRSVLAAPDRRDVGELSSDPRLLAGTEGSSSPDSATQWSVSSIPAIGGRLLAEQPRDAAVASSRAGGTLGTVLILVLAVVGLLLVLVWLVGDRRRRRLEVELQDAHDRATRLMSASPTPFALCDKEGRITLANPALADLFGVPVETLPGELLDSWLSLRDEPRTDGGVYQATVVTPDAEVRLVDMRTQSLGEGDGEPMTLHALVDVTPHRAEQDRLRVQTRTDPLTGLGNRVALREALAAALALPKASHLLLMLDLDGFKAVNDSLGHDVGDDLLVLVARALRHAVRPQDVAARVGGDEFVVLTQLDGAWQRQEAIDELWLSMEQALVGWTAMTGVDVGVSMGSALVGHDGQDLRSLLRVADQRMYDVKRRARQSEGDVDRRPATAAETHAEE